MQLSATIIAVACNQAGRGDFVNAIGGQIPVIPKAGSVKFPCAIFLDDPSVPANLETNLGNIVTANMVIRDGNATGSVLFEQVINAAAFNTELTFTQWQARTAAHFTFAMTPTDTNLSPATSVLWIAIGVTTSDAGDISLVYCGKASLRDYGIFNAAAPTAPDYTSWSKLEADTRYLAATPYQITAASGTETLPAGTRRVVIASGLSGGLTLVLPPMADLLFGDGLVIEVPDPSFLAGGTVSVLPAEGDLYDGHTADDGPQPLSLSPTAASEITLLVGDLNWHPIPQGAAAPNTFTGLAAATTGSAALAQATGAQVTGALTGITTTVATTARAALVAAQDLVPTAVKTAAYTAAAGDAVPVDASAGNVAITLPTAPADRTRVAVKMVAVSGSYTTTVNCGGSDVYNKSGGATMATLTLLNQGAIFQYASATHIWTIYSGDLPLSQLDARYLPRVQAIAAGAAINVTITAGKTLVLFTGTITGYNTINLPSASPYTDGETLTIVDPTGYTAGANLLSISAPSGTTVNGGTSSILPPGQGMTVLRKVGTNWQLDTAPLQRARLGAAGIADNNTITGSWTFSNALTAPGVTSTGTLALTAATSLRLGSPLILGPSSGNFTLQAGTTGVDFVLNNGQGVDGLRIKNSSAEVSANTLFPAGAGLSLGKSGQSWAYIYGGSLIASGPCKLGSYLKAAVPSVSTYSGYYIDVTDATAGAGLYRSNGTNWVIPNTSTVLA